MIALDATVIIAHLSPRDAHHEVATQLFRDAGTQPLIAHTLTIAEVLVGGVKAGRGSEMLADLEGIGIGVAPGILGEPLRLANLRATTGLKLPDCCVLDTALRSAAVLATFDAGLARAARRYDVSVTPH